MSNPLIPLDQAKAGQSLRIHSIPRGPYHPMFIRVGLLEGEMVTCFERLPGGTVVIEKNRQQIAVGVSLACQIMVVLVEGKVAA